MISKTISNVFWSTCPSIVNAQQASSLTQSSSNSRTLYLSYSLVLHADHLYMHLLTLAVICELLFYIHVQLHQALPIGICRFRPIVRNVPIGSSSTSISSAYKHDIQISVGFSPCLQDMPIGMGLQASVGFCPILGLAPIWAAHIYIRNERYL